MNIRSIAYVIVAFRNAADEVAELCSALVEASDRVGSQSRVYLVLNDDSEFPDTGRVTVIQGQGNIGFAAGISLGVKDSSEEFVIMVNPDCKPDITEFVKFLKALPSNGAVLVPRLCGDDGAFDYMPYENWTFTLGRMVSEKLCKFRLLESSGENLPRYAKISGAFVGMDRSIAEALDCPFDSAFFLYAEDRDMTDRIRKSNVPIRFLKDVRITHSGGESGKSVSELVEKCKTDGSLRVAFRRYGRLGAAAFAFDQWCLDFVKAKLGRPVARTAHSWSVARWRKHGFTDPGRLDESQLQAC